MDDEKYPFKSGKDIYEEMVYGTDAVLKRKREETLKYERELAAIRAQFQTPPILLSTEPDAPVIFSHSPTYQKILFRGKEYDLTQHKRAPDIVRVLHESLKKGEPGLTTIQIRKLANLPHNGKMYDWFRGTGLWRNLVVTHGRDMYRLDIP